MSVTGRSRVKSRDFEFRGWRAKGGGRRRLRSGQGRWDKITGGLTIGLNSIREFHGKVLSLFPRILGGSEEVVETPKFRTSEKL